MTTTSSAKTNDASTPRLLGYMQPRTDDRRPDEINAGKSASEAQAKQQHSGRRASGGEPQTASALKYFYAAADARTAKASTDADQ